MLENYEWVSNATSGENNSIESRCRENKQVKSCNFQNIVEAKEYLHN